MATARNDVTGDLLRSKPSNDMFEENFDKIFRKKQSRIDTVGQNGNEGLHYEYELDKSTGNVIKKDNP